MNIRFERLHEIESVRFQSKEERPLSELTSCLLRLGFTRHDDVFSFDRADKIMPWQHGSICEVHAYSGEIEVYGDEGYWDAFELRYLFAFLPIGLVAYFENIVFQVCECLQIAPTVNGQLVGRRELRRILEVFAADLMDECGEEPGTEALAILIAESYPRASRQGRV